MPEQVFETGCLCAVQPPGSGSEATPVDARYRTILPYEGNGNDQQKKFIERGWRHTCAWKCSARVRYTTGFMQKEVDSGGLIIALCHDAVDIGTLICIQLRVVAEGGIKQPRRRRRRARVSGRLCVTGGSRAEGREMFLV